MVIGKMVTGYLNRNSIQELMKQSVINEEEGKCVRQRLGCF
jgi:hypothetical protein